MHVDASPPLVEMSAAASTTVVVTIANTTSLIDAYTVRAFGVDPQWVAVSAPRLSLFPGEVGTVDVSVSLPADFPAGMRQLAIHVQSENDPSEFSFAEVTLDVGSRPHTTMRVDPTMVTGGNKAQFSLIVVNEGNVTVEEQPQGIDPEDVASFAFEPETVVLPPLHREVVQVDVSGGRPWFGQPKPRVVQFNVSGAPPVMATFLQKPRIGRLLISLLGLITVAAVFAAVLSRTLDEVVDEAEVDDALLNEALDESPDEVESVPVDPGAVTGRVTLASTGDGAAGIQAELYSDDNGEVPIASAATDPEGTYAFGRLSAGTFRIRFSGAGFDPVWYTGAATFADASDIEVEAGQDATVDDVELVGQPGSVAGSLMLDDPTGATARLVAPGVADPATPGLVAQVEVSADGSFLFEDVPSPANYELVVDKAGFTTEVRDVVLGPAQELDEIEMTLREGDGMISGRIESPSGALGGVTVTATDGTATISTVSLTQDDIGFFAVRGLATPARYTLTFERDGYTSQTRSVQLGAAEERDGTTVSLVPTTGSISGTVSHGGEPVGGVTVTVTGGDVEMTTTTASQGTPGTYLFQALPAPATYTITFSKDGLVSQSRLEELDPVADDRDLSGIDADLVSDMATVRGMVRDVGGRPVAGATLELTDGENRRTMSSAHDPLGRFEFSGVAPGTYTFSAGLPGSAPEVLLVNVLPADVEEVDISLTEQAALTGQVLVLDPDTDEYVPYRRATVRLFAADDFPGTAAAAVSTVLTDDDGRYTFADLPAPEDFVVAVYAAETSSDALDSVLVQTVPSTEVDVTVFELREAA